MIRNIVFDFGNVIGRYDADELICHFCAEAADRPLLHQAIFSGWEELDAGRISYADYTARAMGLLPARLHGPARAFFSGWHRHMPYVEGIPELIAALKQRGIPLYLLSNASVYFAEHLGEYEVLRGFSGMVISGELKLVKPDPGIYKHLLERYALCAEECLFIDDLEENIEAARRCGMEGYVFDGDTARLRACLFARLGG